MAPASRQATVFARRWNPWNSSVLLRRCQGIAAGAGRTDLPRLFRAALFWGMARLGEGGCCCLGSCGVKSSRLPSRRTARSTAVNVRVRSEGSVFSNRKRPLLQVTAVRWGSIDQTAARQPLARGAADDQRELACLTSCSRANRSRSSMPSTVNWLARFSRYSRLEPANPAAVRMY